MGIILSLDLLQSGEVYAIISLRPILDLKIGEVHLIAFAHSQPYAPLASPFHCMDHILRPPTKNNNSRELEEAPVELHSCSIVRRATRQYDSSGQAGARFSALCANKSTIPRYGVSCAIAYSYVGKLDLATAFALDDETFKSIQNTGC